MAIYLAATLVTCAGVVLFGVTTQRSQLTRQLAGLSRSLQALELAEAALREVSSPGAVRKLLERDGIREHLQSAIQEGTNSGGLVHCAERPLELDPAMVRAGLDPAAPVSLGPVQMTLTEYEPDTGWGMLRFQVEVTRGRGTRARAARFVQDFRFHARNPGGGRPWVMTIERSPRSRRYP